ncbi:MAG: hypothetical protein AAF797_06805 [Planctomycetota bacterium]
MPWFEKLCRNMGLMVHNIKSPDGKKEQQEVSRNVEEKQVNETTTVRRTTIEEIEVKNNPAESNPSP